MSKIVHVRRIQYLSGRKAGWQAEDGFRKGRGAPRKRDDANIAAGSGFGDSRTGESGRIEQSRMPYVLALAISPSGRQSFHQKPPSTRSTAPVM